jgi:hypothetical protein
MKNETQIRAVDYSDNYSQLERNLIDEILACDESKVCFIRKYDGFFMGSIFFVFDYDSEPDEIVCDCTDNAYTHNLLKTEADQ